MEINNLPPQPTVAPIRAPSAVDDGDAGSNSPYYRRRKPKAKLSSKGSNDGQAPRLEGSASRIDIRV